MKLSKIWGVITITVLIILFSRCYYDSEEFLFPQINPCDTSNVSFDTDIVPLIKLHCLTCHGDATAAANGTFKLVTYDDIITHKDRIVGSVFWESGYVPMPFGLPQLSSCQMNTIKSWIDAGALKN